jgi:uncharacterized ferritin-like protein (DUF455 family)
VFVLFSGLNGNSKHIIDIKLEDEIREVEVLLKWWRSSTQFQGSSAVIPKDLIRLTKNTLV